MTATTDSEPMRPIHPAAAAKAKSLRERAEYTERKGREKAERMLRQAYSLEEKGYAYADEPEEITCERLSSWNNYMRRIGGASKFMNQAHDSDIYGHAMTLYRFLARKCRYEAKAISFSQLTRHMRFKAAYVRTLLGLLQGRSAKRTTWPDKGKQRRAYTYPGFPPNERGEALLTVKPAAGRKPSIYALAPPPKITSLWEAQECGLMD